MSKKTKYSAILFKDAKSFEKFVDKSTDTLAHIIKSESSKKPTPKRKRKIKTLKKSKKFIESFKQSNANSDKDIYL